MKMVKRSQSVPCTEIFLVLSGIQVDQLQNAIIHFMAEAGLSLKEGFRWTFQKKFKFTGEFSCPLDQVFVNCVVYPVSLFLLSFFFSNTYSFCSLNSRYMHQVQKITFRRKREKRNTNTSGEYILTSKVVPLVTQFFCLFGNLAAKSEL